MRAEAVEIFYLHSRACQASTSVEMVYEKMLSMFTLCIFYFSGIIITTMVASRAPISYSYKDLCCKQANPLIPNATKQYCLPSRKVMIRSSAHSGTLVYNQFKQNRNSSRIITIIGGLVIRPRPRPQWRLWSGSGSGSGSRNHES